MTKIRTASEELQVLLIDLESEGFRLAKAVRRNEKAQVRLMKIMNLSP